MSFLASFKTYWANTSALNTALPASKVFLELVPPQTAFPYCRFSVLTCVPSYFTSTTHIETLSYQLSFFDTDLEALLTLTDTVMANLDQVAITAGTLLNTRQGRTVTTEVQDGVYTYNVTLEYDWSYNTLTT